MKYYFVSQLSKLIAGFFISISDGIIILEAN